jgi:NAD(P)-dependent dehydrogenase (short-subunit alcohol dehydrogenase family)
MKKIEDLFSIRNKVAAVTGGGGVLCGSMAKALASAGAKVAVLDLFEEAAQKVAKEIKDAGGQAIAVKVDVLNKANVAQSLEQIIQAFGGIDILVNGAGGNKKEATTSPDLSFFDLPQDAFTWVFNLNFIGSLLPCQVYGKHFAGKKSGNIINISSMNAFRPLTRVPAYSSAKAAISNFTQWLAVHMNQEYSPHIRVNALAPGFFLTEQNRFLLTDKESGKLTPRGQSIISHTPANRFGEPEDLSGCLLWLASPASAFVNGIVVPVDGGYSAFSGV